MDQSLFEFIKYLFSPSDFLKYITGIQMMRTSWTMLISRWLCDVDYNLILIYTYMTIMISINIQVNSRLSYPAIIGIDTFITNSKEIIMYHKYRQTSDKRKKRVWYCWSQLWARIKVIRISTKTKINDKNVWYV